MALVKTEFQPQDEHMYPGFPRFEILRTYQAGFDKDILNWISLRYYNLAGQAIYFGQHNLLDKARQAERKKYEENDLKLRMAAKKEVVE